MDEAHVKAQATRQRNRAAWKAREAARREAMELDKPLIVEALRAVLSASDATAKERLFAVIALDEIGGYNIIPYSATRIIRDEVIIADFSRELDAYSAQAGNY